MPAIPPSPPPARRRAGRSGRYLVGHTADGRVFLSLLQDPDEQYGTVFDQGDVSGWSDV